MTPEEIEAFLFNGRNASTSLVVASEQLLKFADSFEARGGEPTFGADALEIVYISNDLQIWLTPERRATLAKYRVDV